MGEKFEIKSSHPTISAETNFWDKYSIPTLEMVRSLHIHRVIEKDRYNYLSFDFRGEGILNTSETSSFLESQICIECRTQNK